MTDLRKLVGIAFCMALLGTHSSSYRSYEKYNMAYNFYHQLENSSVLAWRTTGCVIAKIGSLSRCCDLVPGKTVFLCHLG